MGARKDPSTKTRSFDSNKIGGLLEVIAWEVDKIGVDVKSIVIHREATDAWFGTITYDPRRRKH